MSQLFSIKDKVILITGSSRGIGFELARIMGGEGARVILNGKDAAKLDAAVSELKERGVPAYAAAFDVTDTAGVERAVEDIHSRIGPVDVLVNNAGVQIRSPLEDFAKSDLEKILSVNLEGAFTVSQVVGRYMIRRQKGKIINICSVQSELGRPSIVPYAMSKGGLKMMTKGMAAEWGKHNIQVNGLGPGYFKTDLTKPLVEDDAFSSWLYARVPAGRWGEPAELAGAAIFLASSAFPDR